MGCEPSSSSVFWMQSPTTLLWVFFLLGKRVWPNQSNPAQFQRPWCPGDGCTMPPFQSLGMAMEQTPVSQVNLCRVVFWRCPDCFCPWIDVQIKVKWFTDGAQFCTNHELLIWLWSSVFAKTSWCTKYIFAGIPMRFLPTKALKKKANKVITDLIAWDSSLAGGNVLSLHRKLLFSCMYVNWSHRCFPNLRQNLIGRNFSWARPIWQFAYWQESPAG